MAKRKEMTDDELQAAGQKAMAELCEASMEVMARNFPAQGLGLAQLCSVLAGGVITHLANLELQHSLEQGECQHALARAIVNSAKCFTSELGRHTKAVVPQFIGAMEAARQQPTGKPN